MQILKQKVLGTRGKWAIMGRLVLIHNQIRRCEIYLIPDESATRGNNDVGWDINDLQALANILKDWQTECS